MRKRILSALLATLMLASILSGCGGKQNDSPGFGSFPTPVLRELTTM